MGGLRTYQVYEPLKVHAGFHKLNRERLRKAVPRLWGQLESANQDLAHDLAQGVLVSNLAMVADVLDDFSRSLTMATGFSIRTARQKTTSPACWVGSNAFRNISATSMSGRRNHSFCSTSITSTAELGEPSAPFLE